MTRKSWSILGLIILTSTAAAEVTPVTVKMPTSRAWVGQRVPFFVELRASGSFAGTARFDLPQIPGTTIIKVGSPVVSSQTIEGRSWFMQTHEFALFSQQSGLLEIPEFSVHFADRDSFTGTVQEMKDKTSAAQIEIKQPPGSEKLGILVTTESLNVTETWEPEPGPVQVGALLKRSIIQRAEQLSGMTLTPAETTAPDSVRIYRSNAEIRDQFDRGDFIGERRETLTYLLTQSGTFTLPELTYQWWNPKTETIESKTLPAVIINVSAAPVSSTPNKPLFNSYNWFLAAVFLIGLATWQRQTIALSGRRLWKRFNPPSRVAARKLLRACRQHDAFAAGAAWITWRSTQDAGFQPSPRLSAAVLELHRQRFGPHSLDAIWQGDEFALAFNENIAALKGRSTRKSRSTLPLLNP